MLETMAIVHAPGADDSQVQILVKKLERAFERINFRLPAITVNASAINEGDIFGFSEIPSTLIVGWGLPEKPEWSNWAYAIKTSTAIRLFIAIDLYEPDGASGRVLIAPSMKKGRYWRYRSWQVRLKCFLKDYHISHVSPYGMNRIPVNFAYDEDYALSDRYVLVPGSPQEIEIVRLVFDLFAHHGYTVTEISNLLNAQGVNAPHKGRVWNFKKVKSLITSAVYIGSNQYGACVKHNVFPALVERSTFYAAQAMIHKKMDGCDQFLRQPV